MFPFASMTPSTSPDYDILDVDTSQNCFNDPHTTAQTLGNDPSLNLTDPAALVIEPDTNLPEPVPSPGNPQPANHHPGAPLSATTSTPLQPPATPAPPPTTTRTHSMTTRASHDICKPVERLNLHTDFTTPFPVFLVPTPKPFEMPTG